MDEMTVRHMLTDDLLRLGLRRGGVVLAHSSLRSLGKLPDRAETVVQALIDALGPSGTLLMPALSYLHVGPDQPAFDVLRTPSNVGALPEYFRTRNGSLRSLHPTHSVCAVGPDSCAFLGKHHLDNTPCGPHSPFRLLRDAGGQILFIGCGLTPNTSMHGVEELVEPPYLFRESSVYQLRDADNHVIEITMRNHDFKGCAQRYDRLEDVLDGSELRKGLILSATCHLIECKCMWAKAQRALQANPLFFVEHTDS
ncbi:MAG: AAC(3) family N-acetyltransferase [bacterium]